MSPAPNGPDATEVTRRQAACDVAVVAGGALAYVVAGQTGVGHAWVIAGVGVVLGGYAVLVIGRRGEMFRDFGFRADNLGPAAKLAGAWTAAAALLILAVALLRSENPLRPELLVLLPLYPIWGVVQQAIFQGVLHRRLLRLLPRPTAALALTAAAFGLVHVGNAPLVGLTFAAGLVWSRLFQRCPNVWVLGASHGVLAALAYPLVLGANPLERM